MNGSRLLLACLLLLLSFASFARQDPVPVKQAVEDFLRRETQGLPGRVSFTVGGLAADNRLTPCSAFEVRAASTAQLWGRTQVAVQCRAEANWRAFVPVQIHVQADYLVAARPLAQGQAIGEGDLRRQSGDLSELPSGLLTDPAQAIGRSPVTAIAAGRPLRADMLRLPVVVQQNQTVQVVSTGPGFQVSNEGRALGSASAGQVVQVRLANGQVVTGIARSGGRVEVGY